MDLTIRLQPKQAKAAQYWLDNDTEEILYGGAKGGAKSYLGASLIFQDALIYPETMYFIARRDLTDLKKYTLPTIQEVISNWGIDFNKYIKYNGQENYFNIYNKSKVFFMDCKYLPSDPQFHRFGSMQFTRGWMEEIGEMHDKAVINLSATVGRWKNEQYGLKRKVLMTCNPNKKIAYNNFYLPNKQGTLPEFRKFITALPSDNKYLPTDYINALSRLPQNEKERLLLGNWEYDDDPNTLVEYKSITDIWTNTFVPGGNKFLTADIALHGSDRFVIAVWDGWRLIDWIAIPKSSGKEVLSLIKTIASKYRIPNSRIAFDSDGVGGFLEGSNGFLPGSLAFHAQGRAKDDKNYATIKDECGFKLANRINEAGMYIATELYKSEAVAEIEQLKNKDIDSDGRLRLMPKDDIKTHIGRSPDLLDVMILREFIEIKLPPPMIIFKRK